MCWRVPPFGSTSFAVGHTDEFYVLTGTASILCPYHHSKGNLVAALITRRHNWCFDPFGADCLDFRRVCLICLLLSFVFLVFCMVCQSSLFNRLRLVCHLCVVRVCITSLQIGSLLGLMLVCFLSVVKACIKNLQIGSLLALMLVCLLCLS